MRSLSWVVLMLLCGWAGAQEPAAPEEKEEEETPKVEEKAPLADGEEMVVTAERLETERRMSGESYGIVDLEKLEIRQDDEVQEAIRLTPGVHVAQTGGKGGLTSLFIRGGESDHALVLIDGMEVNSDGGGIDLSLLTTDGAGRIEIVRGAGSSIWGADSMSGTVHLMTKRGRGEPRAWVSAEGGNFSTYRERARFEAGDDTYGLTLAISRYDRWDGRFDHSDYHNTTVAGRFDYEIGEATTMKATVRYVDEEAEQFGIDPGPKYIVEDGNGEKREDDLVLGLEVAHRFLDEWTVTARVGRFDEDARFDDLGEFDTDSTSDFERTKAGLQSDAELIHTDDFRNIFTVGTEWEREELTQTNSFTTGLGTNERRNNKALWVQNRFEAFDRLAVVLSGRIDDSRAFGSAETGKASLTYHLKETDTRLHGSIGKGIKTPTMTESFSTNPFFLGNRDLDPEKARSMDLGIEQRICGDFLVADLTFFQNRMRDLIDFTGGTPAFQNSGDARVRGFEFQIESRPVDGLRLAAGWTHQRSRVIHTDVPSLTFIRHRSLIRRPDHAAYAELAYESFYTDDIPESQRREHPKFSISLHAQYVGYRDDILFQQFPDPALRFRNKDYVKADLAIEYWIVDRAVRFFGTIENLTDSDFEEVAGWPVDPVNFLAGVEFTFGVPKLKRKPKKD